VSVRKVPPAVPSRGGSGLAGGTAAGSGRGGGAVGGFCEVAALLMGAFVVCACWAALLGLLGAWR